MKLCQRRREKIYLASELKNKPVPTRALAAATAAAEMRKAKQVLSSTRWFIRGPMIRTHVDPELAADPSSGLLHSPSFTVSNYKPETSNSRFPSLHFFSDWLVPQTHDGNLRLTEVPV